MKTKQTFLSLALALILILALTACGASSSKTSSSSSQTALAGSAPKDAGTSYTAELGDAAKSQTAGGTTSASSSDLSESITSLPTAEKIIYSGSAQIETLSFDKTLQDLQKMISDSGGFVQSSSVSGNDYKSIYNGNGSYRTANYTIRIPADKFKSVEDRLTALGNVIGKSTNAENITMQYTDTQSRLDTCHTKEARLLELLSKAANMEDILAIENSLSDVRYQIETLTSQIKNWDSLISYSTLTISIQEVALYSKDNSSTIGYGQQLKQAFIHSMNSIGQFFKSFLKFLVGAFPILVVLAIITIPVYFIIRAIRKKKAVKKLSPTDNTDDTPPQS